VAVRKVFISYARQNKPDVEQLVEHLRVLGCETWHDSSLHGGQDWWEEILRQIADCDTFIAIISREALNSKACELEFDWAESLKKPVLPVSLDPLTRALPRRFSTRQIVNYSNRAARDRAAVQLGGGLATLSAAPPLPDPLPKAPPAPLSYLTDIIDLVNSRQELTHDQQRHIVNSLESALRSLDLDERRGARDILEKLSSRDDLYKDVDETISRLQRLAKDPAGPPRDSLFRRLFLWRQHNSKIVAGAAVIAVVALIAIATVMLHNHTGRQQVSNDNASGRQSYKAYVLAPKPGLTGAPVYAEPNTSSHVVANLPEKNVVYVDCVVEHGDSVEGPGVQGGSRQTTDLWDRIRLEGDGSDLGYMPDVWVNTNTAEPVAPKC
jgi:hypothetical protein